MWDRVICFPVPRDLPNRMKKKLRPILEDGLYGSTENRIKAFFSRKVSELCSLGNMGDGLIKDTWLTKDLKPMSPTVQSLSHWVMFSVMGHTVINILAPLFFFYSQNFSDPLTH